MSKKRYPEIDEAEKQRELSTKEIEKQISIDDEPDFIGDKPNYEKFEKMGWDTEQILVWLNID